jgi:c-di-GMP-binding flagellar brake protein YcgR
LLEQRRHVRYPLKTEAEVRFTTWSVFRILYTVNISQGGMTVGLPEPAEVGSMLDIRLSLPGDQVIELKAVVRHCGRSPGTSDNYRAGVEFLDLDAERRAEIETVLAAYAA